MDLLIKLLDEIAGFLNEVPHTPDEVSGIPDEIPKTLDDDPRTPNQLPGTSDEVPEAPDEALNDVLDSPEEFTGTSIRFAETLSGNNSELNCQPSERRP